MYLIIKYPNLVRPGAGTPDEINEGDDGRLVGFDTRRDAARALKAAYPGKTLREIFAYSQKRIERSRCT